MNCHPRSGRVLNLDKLFVIHLVWFCESCRELPVKCKPQAVFRTFFENLIDQFFLLFCISIQFCIIFQECQVTDPVYLLLSPATLFQALENIWICFFFAQKYPYAQKEMYARITGSFPFCATYCSSIAAPCLR